MNEEDIKRIKSKLELIDDSEFKNLILELLNERNELYEVANIDSLTGVYTRRVLDKVRRYDTVIICDVDKFKLINDKYGHCIGDKVLKMVASTFKKCVRFEDVVCRYGGDEFLLIFNDFNLDSIIKRLERINKIISESLPDLNISISYGVSVKEDNESLEELIQKADIALYQSKENPENKITVYCKDKTRKKVSDIE